MIPAMTSIGRLASTLFAAACLAAVGCGGNAVRASSTDPGPSTSQTTTVASSPSAFRLHGTIEPVRSQMVTVPRLTGTGVGSIVIVHLAKAGEHVNRGDTLVEFDSAAQIKTAHD